MHKCREKIIQNSILKIDSLPRNCSDGWYLRITQRDFDKLGDRKNFTR